MIQRDASMPARRHPRLPGRPARWRALCWAGLLVAGLPSAAASGPDPARWVQQFYTLMGAHRCAEALALRPDQDAERRGQFVLLAEPQAEVALALGDLALVRVDARYRAGDVQGRDAGCVVLTLPAIDPLPPTADLSNEAPTAVPGPAPGADCWGAEALRGSPAEARIRHQRPPGGTPPDPALIARAAVAHPPLPPAWRGSIRWVDLHDPQGKLLALTFDLCEQADEITGYDAAIVDYLREQGVRATFFAGGKWLQSHPERARQLLADPNFEVGNHAWTHGNLRVIEGRELREQILWTQAEALAQHDALATRCPATAAARPTVPAVFRFPYGTCSQAALDTLAELGLAAVQWDIVSGDPARGQTAAGIVRAVQAGLTPGRGHIVVMHANGRGRATAAALRQLVPALRAQGWRFVTVSELLAAGTPHQVGECYELQPGDNARYDKLFGRGTGD